MDSLTKALLPAPELSPQERAQLMGAFGTSGDDLREALEIVVRSGARLPQRYVEGLLRRGDVEAVVAMAAHAQVSPGRATRAVRANLDSPDIVAVEDFLYYVHLSTRPKGEQARLTAWALTTADSAGVLDLMEQVSSDDPEYLEGVLPTALVAINEVLHADERMVLSDMVDWLLAGPTETVLTGLDRALLHPKGIHPDLTYRLFAKPHSQVSRRFATSFLRWARDRVRAGVDMADQQQRILTALLEQEESEQDPTVREPLTTYLRQEQEWCRDYTWWPLVQGRDVFDVEPLAALRDEEALTSVTRQLRSPSVEKFLPTLTQNPAVRDDVLAAAVFQCGNVPDAAAVALRGRPTPSFAAELYVLASYRSGRGGTAKVQVSVSPEMVPFILAKAHPPMDEFVEVLADLDEDLFEACPWSGVLVYMEDARVRARVLARLRGAGDLSTVVETATVFDRTSLGENVTVGQVCATLDAVLAP